jgi:hypothetical protein
MKHLQLLLLWGALITGPGLSVVCRAVDPLPVELRDAPLEKRMEYLDKRGEESRRQREAVGKQRFEEHQQFLQSVAVGMQQELAARQTLLSRGTGGSPGATSSDPVMETRDQEAGSLGPKLAISALILAGLSVLYQFRERLLPRLYQH